VKRALAALVLVGCAAAAPRVEVPALAPALVQATPRAPLPVCDVIGGFPNKDLSPPRVYSPDERVKFFFSEPLRDCGIPQTITLSLDILGQTCGPPFHSVNVKWKTAIDDRDYFDIDHWTPEVYRRGWETLLDVVRDIVDPACIYDAAARADQNPRFAQCPMPAELTRAFSSLPDTPMETSGFGHVPAGLYAFVSALAAYDTTAAGRMLQLKLLYGAGEARPVDPHHRPKPEACTPEGFYPDALQPD
jgi:hypothetical protein